MWDLLPRPGMESRSPALTVWSLSHWTAREVHDLLSTTFIRIMHNLQRVNYTCHVVHYIPGTYLPNKWKSVPFDHFQSLLLVMTNLFR